MSRDAEVPYAIAVALPGDAEDIMAVESVTCCATYPSPELGITVDDIRVWVDGENNELRREKSEALRDALTRRRLAFFTAKNAGSVVGYMFAFGEPSEGHRRRIGLLYVLPEHQGRGLGTRLLRTALDVIGTEHPAFVRVAEHNHRAEAFYARHGFVRTGRDTTHLATPLPDGRRMREFEMVRPVPTHPSGLMG